MAAALSARLHEATFYGLAPREAATQLLLKESELGRALREVVVAPPLCHSQLARFATLGVVRSATCHGLWMRRRRASTSPETMSDTAAL